MRDEITERVAVSTVEQSISAATNHRVESMSGVDESKYEWDDDHWTVPETGAYVLRAGVIVRGKVASQARLSGQIKINSQVAFETQTALHPGSAGGSVYLERTEQLQEGDRVELWAFQDSQIPLTLPVESREVSFFEVGRVE